MSSRKRSRTEFGRSSRRAIDKDIKSVAVSSTTTQTVTTLKTTTFPCTVVGLRWEVNYLKNVTVNAATMYWAIVVVKDGNAASTIATSDGSTFYAPEQNVLSWGILSATDSDLASGPMIGAHSGSSKTMRKLAGGDLLQFITLSNIAASGDTRAVVQFFCKA